MMVPQRTSLAKGLMAKNGHGRRSFEGLGREDVEIWTGLPGVCAGW